MSDTLPPATLTIANAVKHTNLSRATIYRLAGKRLLTLRKSGRRTLVCYKSLAGYLENLPDAGIRPPL
jgi:hypothetical protein